MKKSRKSTIFVVAILIFGFAYLTFFGLSNYFGDKKTTYIKGVNDIRWGIDIQGGVEAVFKPEGKIDKITSAQMDAAKAVIDTRLVFKNITDSEVYKVDTPSNKQIIVRFPWQSGTTDFDPAAAVAELGSTAVLKFCEGSTDKTKVILTGSSDVKKASSGPSQEQGKVGEYVVNLTLTGSGVSKFSEATTRLSASKGSISIWMDDNMISAPTVNEPITNGSCVISGNFTAESAKDLADKINSGSLPFKLSADNSKLKIISPTLGKSALDVMFMAGLIAFAVIALLMILLYRIPGVVATIGVTGQIAGILACVSGFFAFNPSFTLTIPGLAGVILSIGIGVDANVITSERIREELRNGKTIDGALESGFSKGITAVIDGNITVIIVSAVLMGAFGPPSANVFAFIITPLMFMFPPSITGTIYSFGYTLFIGAIFTLIMGVLLSHKMLKSLIRYKFFRNPWLYGGTKNEK